MIKFINSYKRVYSENQSSSFYGPHLYLPVLTGEKSSCVFPECIYKHIHVYELFSWLKWAYSMHTFLHYPLFLIYMK